MTHGIHEETQQALTEAIRQETGNPRAQAYGYEVKNGLYKVWDEKGTAYLIDGNDLQIN